MKLKSFGTIITDVKKEDYKTTFTLKVERIDGDISYKDTNILIKLKNGNCNYKYGDKVLIYGKLEDASVARNEGGFNYKEYLKIKGIYKTINIKKTDIKLIKENNLNIIDRTINNIRVKMKDSAMNILPEKEANFIISILIGDKLNLDEDIKKDFRNSNLSHILAVSGMHVSYVIMGIGFVICKLKVGKKKEKITTIIVLIFFMLLTGSSPSVERACIMSIYMIVGSLLYKRTKVINSLSFSCVFILITNPYALFDIGFQLSFGGTIGIIFLYPILKNCLKIKQDNMVKKIISKITDIMFVTMSANIVIFPIILYHFNTISTVFLISNVLVSPLVGIIILLGFVSTFFYYIFFPVSKIIAIILKLLIDILLNIANVLGNLPFSNIYFVTPKIYMIMIYYLIILYIILSNSKIIRIRRKQIKRFISILLIIIIIFNLFLKIISN